MRQKRVRTSVFLLVEISPLSCDRVAALHVGRGHAKWGWFEASPGDGRHREQGRYREREQMVVGSKEYFKLRSAARPLRSGFPDSSYTFGLVDFLPILRAPSSRGPRTARIGAISQRRQRGSLCLKIRRNGRECLIAPEKEERVKNISTHCNIASFLGTALLGLNRIVYRWFPGDVYRKGRRSDLEREGRAKRRIYQVRRTFPMRMRDAREKARHCVTNLLKRDTVSRFLACVALLNRESQITGSDNANNFRPNFDNTGPTSADNVKTGRGTVVPSLCTTPNDFGGQCKNAKKQIKDGNQNVKRLMYKEFNPSLHTEYSVQ
ncbi:hypothetical protein B0H19DRAFT_1079440 [Mycena capillaripes]|nr:hypothetical protein B0H19DRAFT_1079440 [Mycena capillaripes]